jgi:hypothetical protein
MFILPCIYILSFLIALYRTVRGSPQNILLFFVFGLPLYFTALSIAYMIAGNEPVPFLQAFKEIIVATALTVILIKRKKPVRLQLLDKLVLAFLFYCLLYVLLPLGPFGFTDKLLAFKSLSFFPFVYFTGRLMDAGSVDINKYFHYICFLSILAAIVLLGEVITDEHLQTYTGFSAFNEQFFGQESTGNFGLNWTFETENGIKRFASFFSQPLELGVNTVLAIAVIAGMSTKDDNQLKPDLFVLSTFVMTLLSIVFAFSRASFASYFIILYVYAIITKRKTLLRMFHYGFLAVIVFIFFWLSGDIYELIITTVNFSNSSSAFHILQWLEGIEAIMAHPLGLGLGTAGRVSIETGSNIGGENQLIIIGVQAGVLAIVLYTAIYVYTLRLCTKMFRNSTGKIKKLSLTLLLAKIGLIIPVLTANTEAYIYVMYITWFFTGLLVSVSADPAERNYPDVLLSPKELPAYC